jgi:mannitol-1-phosphate/altronate dehydrogenase
VLELFGHTIVFAENAHFDVKSVTRDAQKRGVFKSGYEYVSKCLARRSDAHGLEVMSTENVGHFGGEFGRIFTTCIKPLCLILIGLEASLSL